MLGQRIVTALLLLAVLLLALAATSPLPIIAVAGLVVGAAGWEWSRLSGVQSRAFALAGGIALAMVCLVTTAVVHRVEPPAALWWAATGLWALGGALVLRGGPAAWKRLPVGVRWGLGMGALILAWLAVARARMIGVNFLFSAMCIVWIADIAAYFGGRAFGRRKLAPTISPGKSWAGVWSGIAGVLVLAAAWLAFDALWTEISPSVFTVLHSSLGLLGMAIALVALCALSVVGDLIESLVKRAAGAKDSSRLLPGHGGVLDRIDSLLPILPAVLAASTL